MDLPALPRCDLCEMQLRLSMSRFAWKMLAGDNALLLITSPCSLLLWISTCSKCRLHADSLWISTFMCSADGSYLCFVTDTVHGLRTRKTKRGGSWQQPVINLSGNQSCYRCCVVCGESHIYGAFIIPPYSCSKPTRPCGSTLRLSWWVHSAQHHVGKVYSTTVLS